MISENEIEKALNDLFPLCRSITGKPNIKTINYLKDNIIQW